MTLASVACGGATCPTCKMEFLAKRSNKKFCSRGCQKVATHNTSRPPRTVAGSPDERRRHATRSKRLQGLTDALFETPPRYRAEFMEKVISEARGKAELRQWLTKREALGCRWHNQGTGRLHIAFCLDHYCKEIYRMRSFKALNPATELPSGLQTAYPAAYYDPYQPPLFEDGSLQRRPCPWSTGTKAIATKAPGNWSGVYDWRKIASALVVPAGNVSSLMSEPWRLGSAA
jgi:hypothetical protein